MAVRGSCLCGEIAFEIDAPLRPVVNCHCGQCRKWTGHYVAATAAWRRHLRITDASGLLGWYRSSDRAERGFCKRCGSSLFWRSSGADTMSIMAGTLDAPTGLATVAQIFVDHKGDYYALGDPHAAVHAQTGHGVALPPQT